MAFKKHLRAAITPLVKRHCITLTARSPEGNVRVPILQGTGAGVLQFVRKRQDHWRFELQKKLLVGRKGIYLDVGANLGQSLIHLRQIDATRDYLGFEPNPDCLHYLYKLIDENNYRNCQIIPAGLGDKAAILQLHLLRGKSTDSNATLLADLRPGEEYDIRQVLVVSGETAAEIVGQRAIGMVKIDVEGAELEVMRGLRALLDQHRAPVICEVLFTDGKGSLEKSAARNAELMELLVQIGYEVHLIHKSPGGMSVQSLEKLAKFPNAYYTGLNSHLCDYLFAPRGTSA